MKPGDKVTISYLPTMIGTIAREASPRETYNKRFVVKFNNGNSGEWSEDFLIKIEPNDILKGIL